MERGRNRIRLKGETHDTRRSGIAGEESAAVSGADTDKKRIYETINKETLTLDCKRLTFQTHQAGCCGFDRIYGHVL